MPIANRLLTVGASGADYTTISAALTAATGATVANRYTVYVYPGTYAENITCKQYVNIVGVNKSSVFIAPAAGSASGNVVLDSYVELQNLTIWTPGNSTSSHYTMVSNNKTNIGIRNVDIIASGGTALGHCLKVTGSTWTTYLIESLGMSYFGTSGYAIEIAGNSASPQNSDMHFINCFVDALFVNGSGGCISVKDCHTLYLRNSLVRTTSVGNCLNTARTTTGLVNVLVEGSALEAAGSSSALYVGSYTTCYFRYAEADSVNVASNAWLVRAYPDRILTMPGSAGFVSAGGAATVTQNIAGVAIQKTAHGAGADLSIFRRAVPPGTAWDVFALLTPTPFQKSFHSTGLMFRNSSTQRMVVFKYFNNVLGVSKFNTTASFNSDYATGNISHSPGNYGLWLRLGYNAGQLYFHVSPDGGQWLQYFSIPANDFLTQTGGALDEVGFFLDSENSTTPNLPAATTLLHWSTSPWS